MAVRMSDLDKKLNEKMAELQEKEPECTSLSVAVFSVDTWRV